MCIRDSSALNRTGASDDASDETAVRLGRLFQRENVNWLDMDCLLYTSPILRACRFRHAVPFAVPHPIVVRRRRAQVCVR